jgi:hypothetical protein
MPFPSVRNETMQRCQDAAPTQLILVRGVKFCGPGFQNLVFRIEVRVDNANDRSGGRNCILARLKL